MYFVLDKTIGFNLILIFLEMDSRKSINPYYGFLLVKKVNGGICGRFPVTRKECTLGRDNNCDIRILLEKVSALQCIIICVDNKVKVDYFYDYEQLLILVPNFLGICS